MTDLTVYLGRLMEGLRNFGLEKPSEVQSLANYSVGARKTRMVRVAQTVEARISPGLGQESLKYSFRTFAILN